MCKKVCLLLVYMLHSAFFLLFLEKKLRVVTVTTVSRMVQRWAKPGVGLESEYSVFCQIWVESECIFF